MKLYFNCGYFKFFVITLILIGASINTSDGQRRFNAEILAGINAAQINGDNFAGYEHIGLMAGVNVCARYKNNIDFCLDMLYDQRGSSAQLSFNPRVGETGIFFINLDYVSFPLYVKIKDWLVEYQKSDFNYYKFEFIGGISVGQAFNISHQEGFSQPQHYNKTDLSWLIGATYKFNKHIGLSFRYTRTLIPLFSYPDQNNFKRSIIPHHMSFFTSYSF